METIIADGKPLGEADRVLVAVHGRGATPDDILSLASRLNVDGFSFLAPAAPGGSWYPQSFLVPRERNEPRLSRALELLGSIEVEAGRLGIGPERLFFLGFSQGACLVLEYSAMNAKRYGGIIAFTGGLIGDRVEAGRYAGDFAGTPVFIGTSDPDPHVPVKRVEETALLFRSLGADLTLKIYPGMGHTVSMDEIDTVNSLMFGR